MPKRIIVIGGLAAGPSAASKAVRTNPNVAVTLFEQGEHISYGVCEIPYYISGEVQESGLVSYTPATLREKKGVDARILHSVEEIRPSKRIVVVRNLATAEVREERYDRLIVATGSRPKKLGVEGEDARNVFAVKSLSQSFLLKKFIDEEKPRRAVIVGGGYIGMEMSDALRSLDIDVTLLHRHSLPMSGLERETRERIREELEKHGVHFVGNVAVEGIVVDKHRKATHVVSNVGSFETDLVIVAIGVEPNTSLARAAGIRLGAHNGILTDTRQETNLDNIFAAGDCCEVKNLVHNKKMYIPLATIASKAGWVAGENAAGGKATFPGAIRAIAVRVFGLEVAQVGLNASEASEAGFDVAIETVTAWARVAVMPKSTKVIIRMIADRKSDRLLGANVYGEHGAVLRANTLTVAIQHRITIQDMQNWDLAYTPPYTPLWDPILVAANAMNKKLTP
ncbi:MAG: FAD-dependent oxidoreductase [Bacteroidota bacterium]